jgi:hypothetical protein
MTAFEGIVALADGQVPVQVGLEPDRVTLVTGDVQVGEWAVDECVITDQGDGTWIIEAEEDKLSFLPDKPGLFAQSLNGEAAKVEVPEADPLPQPLTETVSDSGDEDGDFEIVDGPEPRSATLVGFYSLAGVTGVLALWALISLFT